MALQEYSTKQIIPKSYSIFQNIVKEGALTHSVIPAELEAKSKYGQHGKGKLKASSLMDTDTKILNKY